MLVRKLYIGSLHVSFSSQQERKGYKRLIKYILGAKKKCMQAKPYEQKLVQKLFFEIYRISRRIRRCCAGHCKNIQSITRKSSIKTIN